MDDQRDDVAGLARDVLIRQGVEIAAMLLLIWALGPGKDYVAMLVTRVREWRKRDPHEGTIRAFAREVSDWDHEQATQADRKPAGGGPCGCGQ